MRAVLRGADLDARSLRARRGPEARNTSSRVITIFTGLPGLARQRMRDRLEIDHGLAAEAAADLRSASTRIFEVSMPSSWAQ